LVGAALIVDTYIVILDWVPRLYTDILHTNFEWARKISYTRWYYGLATFFAIWTAVTLFLAQPAELLVWGGVLNFLAWPIMHAAAIYISFRMLPRVFRWSRPGLIWLVVGLVITAIYTYLAVWYIGVTFKLF
jgi:Mn2+/Fe2+ NRAMP family transporter